MTGASEKSQPRPVLPGSAPRVASIDTPREAAPLCVPVQREPIAERLLEPGPSAWRACLSWAYRLLLLLAAVIVARLALRATWAFTIDDAGISYAYAKHIAEGEGPVAVVGGPWVEGYSNPLWVFLLIPLHALGLDLPVVAKWLASGLFALGLAAGGAFIARVAGRRVPGAIEACFVVASAACLELVVWVPAGLENALFGALLLGLVYLDARESERPDAFAASGLAAFALSITRPEGVLYAAPLILLKLGRAWTRKEPLRQALSAALLLFAPLALYHVGHYLVFGQLVANTYWAKPPGKTWDKGLEYLLTSLRESGLAWAVPLALIGLYGKLRVKLPVAWTSLAGVLFVLYSGGDWMPNGRFVSLFAPSLLVLAALGLERVVRVLVGAVLWLRGTRALARSNPWREAVAVLLAGGVTWAWLGYQLPRLKLLERQGWCHFCERVADTERIRQLGSRASIPSQSIVTHDFGGPAWLSAAGFYPLDFLGLCDRSAALLRHARASGSVGYDLRLYQYFIHEQPTPPSWVALPPNFWPLFERSPEAVLDYYPLAARLLPRARRDSYFVLHRGELVDYFPPLPPAPLRPLSERFALVGFAPLADPDSSLTPGAHVRLAVSVVPRVAVEAGARIGVRVEADTESVDSALVPIDRGIDGLARALLPGEPLWFELPLVLPRTAAPRYRVSVGVTGVAPGSKRRQTPPVFAALGELAAGAPLMPLERGLPRYPSALPAARDPELQRLRPRLVRVIEQSRRSGQAPEDAPLARELIAQAERLEASGDTTQAYLGYVWATQSRRRAWEDLADTVFRLRQLSLGDEHTLEIALLRRYYSSGSARDLERLSAYYLALGRAPEADHFLRRLPEEGADPELVQSLGAALAAQPSGGPEARALASAVFGQVAFDPLGGALDFEAEDQLDGWQGQREAFRSGARADRHGMPGLRGQHGAGVLASRSGGESVRGALTSPEFRLDGQLLSVLVGGGSRSRRVGVELLVEGKAVFSAAGNDSDNLLPFFWDISPFAGQLARLRVFDESPRDHIVLDRVLLWR